MASKTLIVHPIYNRIVSRFPQNLTFCFAYGSGVKKQLSKHKSDPTKNMIDLIFCVDNPIKWHQANLLENSSHYSILKILGANWIAKLQENSGSKVYYNTLVPIDGLLIKYGVVSTKDLVTDLLEWSDLYLAGRLHKPVEVIKEPSVGEIQTALQLNLQSAVHAALLILPDSFTEYEFYCTIARLSYDGDFRMIFGENKNKVENIVRPQMLDFRELYRPCMKLLHDYVDFPIISSSLLPAERDIVEQKKIELSIQEAEKASICTQDVSPLARLHHLNQLPRWPQVALTRFWNKGSLHQDTEDVLRAVAYDPDCSLIVQECINKIVWNSSIKQSLKGILTAGFLKSVKYSSQKIAKMIK
ncbi:phosphatidate cytidylyltransferase, mitochondrial [Agrilus planipennis]|uniref:Phosphatidate cytidylyltransferase, mitochondrial n=1 Tax=Agrilus planipennis TaxID=224129 RepID=A0A1W4W624_AGRPL|nr:phosphatidate cytidylyltransferase, mitochondrial [Agrilus planipennis]